MMLDTLHLLTAGLSHPVYGVTAQLATLGTTGISAPVVAPTLIVDETTRPELAVGLSPQTNEYPCVLVVQPQPVTITATQSRSYREVTDAQLAVSVRHQGNNQADTVQAVLMLMRAVHKSIEALFLNANAGDRTRNAVHLVSYSNITHHPVSQSENDSVAIGELQITLHIRDTNISL